MLAGLTGRAKNSVEVLLARDCPKALVNIQEAIREYLAGRDELVAGSDVREVEVSA